MSASQPALFNVQEFTDNGVTLVGGRLYTYAYGTTAQKVAYTDPEGTVPQTYTADGLGGQYIALNTRGELPTPLYLGPDPYDIALKRPDGSTVWTRRADGVTNAFTAITGASLIGWTQSGAGAVRRSVQDKLRDYVSVLDFYKPGDADYTAAAQRATDTGRAVYWPDGTYIVTAVTCTGRVLWFGRGGATIRSDGAVLTVTEGAGSRVMDLRFENITAPWLINRNPGNWTEIPAVAQSNGDGYQPTSNDTDIWPSLTEAQKIQNVGPTIKFQGNAGDIYVSGLTGRFLSILLYDTTQSTVEGCNFQAGKNFAGGILFWNLNGQAGYGNRALNNIVKYSSYSGITFARNYNGLCSGNSIDYPGESGIKTNQGVINTVDSRCYRMQITDNQSQFAFYDGFDLSSDYPHTGLIDSRHDISNNSTFGCRQTGFFADGQNNQFDGNLARGCGDSGMQLTYSFSSISDNHVYDCNKSNIATGTHQIAILGGGNSIVGNYIRQVSPFGSALYAPSNNYCASNFSPDGPFFFGVEGAITSTLVGNRDFSNVGVMSYPQRIRQVADNFPGLEIRSDTINATNLSFHPRSVQLANPIGLVSGEVTYGISGAENGALVGYAAQGGVLRPGFRIQADNTIPGKAWLGIYAPNTTVPPSFLLPGTLTFSLDEAANLLRISVKYSSGVTKTGQISLT